MTEEYREWAREEIAEARAGRVYGTSVTHEAMMAMYDVEQAMRRLLTTRADTSRKGEG